MALPLLICCALLVAGSAVAATGATDEVHACRANKGGALRAVAATTKCRDGESRLVWNVQGLRGPCGYRGYRGAPGPQGPAGIAVAQSCPEGQYVSGIATDGTLTCTPLPTEAPPPTESETPTPTDSETAPVDTDEDGYAAPPGGDDCDDNNASINPGATEILNQADDDCDGDTDEGFLSEVDAPDFIQTGGSGKGTVYLYGPAETDVSVSLAASNTSVIGVPASVTVPAGASTGEFTISGLSNGTAYVTATLNETTVASGNITVGDSAP